MEVDLFELLCKVLDHNLFAQVDWARNSYYFKELKVRQKVPYRYWIIPILWWLVSKQCKKWFLENNWGSKTYSHHHWLYHFTWSENHVDGNSFLLVVIKFIGMFALLICCRVHIFTVWKQLWTLKQSANCGKNQLNVCLRYLWNRKLSSLQRFNWIFACLFSLLLLRNPVMGQTCGCIV